MFRFINRNLGIKLILGALVIPGISGLIIGQKLLDDGRATLLEMMAQQGNAVSQTIALSIVDPLLVDDYTLIDEYLEELTKDIPDLTFVSVRRSSDKKIVAAIHPTGIPEEVLFDQESMDSGFLILEKKIRVAGGIGNALGTVRVGLSTERVEGLIFQHQSDQRRIFGYSLGATFVLLALLLRSTVLRPLHFLGLRAKSLGAGDYRASISLPQEDEMGGLADSLDVMRQNLGATYRQVRNQNSELEQALEQLRQALDKARAADLAKSHFLATVSHEIRTPMNGILGMNSLLLESKLDEDQILLARTVQNSGKDLLVIINDILDFSKIESGMLDIECYEFDLHRLLEEVVDLLGSQAFGKGLEFTCHLDTSVPQLVNGDPGRLRQILMNLVGNAVKYTKEGEIRIQVSTAQSEVKIGHPFELIISIHDTGIGIPKDVLGTIFNPFQQADSSTTRRFGGTGLGLSICKELAELMNGNVGVTSVLGEGSTFTLTIFLGYASESSDAKEALGGELKFLIVDEGSAQRNVLQAILKAWGFHSEGVEDGAKGLMAMHTAVEDFDYVLLDIHSKRITWNDFANAAAKIPGECPRFVLMASSAEKPTSMELEDANIDVCLTKPIVQSRLYDLIAEDAFAESGGDAISSRSVPKLIQERFKSKKLRVLVVEDKQVNQAYVGMLLDKLGILFDLADDGIDALAKLEHQSFDLILMDVSMPTMDGFEATRRIREIEKGRGDHIPIIAVTANAMKEDRGQCLQAGMDDYLSKPLQEDLFIDLLVKWLLDGDELRGQAG